MQGVIVDLAAEGRKTLRRGFGNIAEAHQAHPADRQLRDALHHAALLHLHLASLPDSPVAGKAVAQEHQHQQNRLLRYGAGVAALVVAHPDAPLSGGSQVDLVIGHPLGVDQLQVVHIPDQRALYRRNGVHKQHVRIASHRQDRLLVCAFIQKHQLLLTDKGQSGHVFLIPCLSAQNQNFHNRIVLLLSRGLSSVPIYQGTVQS